MEGPRAFPLNRLSAPLGSANAVLRARSRTHFVKDFPGPLSIKSVTAGRVSWKREGRELVVDRDSFLVLNRDEPYSLDIESRTPVGTLCVFFQNEFVESVQASMADADLDATLSKVLFLGSVHADDGQILPRMHALATAPDAPSLWLDEQFLRLARDLLLLNRDLRRRVERMPARKASTREELFRRVRRGLEYLHANPAEDLSLAAIARESCLSPYHFHRSFTQAFGRTPQQYRNHLRLAQARRLLETTTMTVTEICGAVGFESAPSFSLLFRQSFGVPPTAIRKLSNSR